jgi:hypothetical protein
MPPEERQAYIAELRARRAEGTLAEVLQPDDKAVERMVRDARKERVSADRRRR